MTRTDVSMTRLVAGSQLVGAEVLVVDQDERIHEGIADLLGAASIHVTGAHDLEHALEVCERKFFSVMLIDVDTPTPGAGIDTVRTLKDGRRRRR